MWPFKKKVRTDPATGVFNEMAGTFHQLWSHKIQPDIGGASEFAYESLAIAPSSPIGTGVPLRKPFAPLQPQTYFDYGVTLAGQPTQAGGIYGARLFDPDNPTAAQLPGQLSPLASMNIVAIRAQPFATNDPFPDHMRGL